MIVIPVYNIILVPDATMYFSLDQVRRAAGDKNIAVGERVVMIVARENQKYADMTSESFYPIGVSGYISEVGDHGYVVTHVRMQFFFSARRVKVCRMFMPVSPGCDRHR